MPKLNANELRWQTEDDAKAMARYQEIMNDTARKNRAIKEARRQAQDLEKRAVALRAAGGKIKRK